MRVILNSPAHQSASGYVYKMLISTYPHEDFYLHFVLHGAAGGAREKIDLASRPYTMCSLPDGPGFSETDQMCFEEWFARNADLLVDAYRNGRIFDFEQAFD